MQHGPTVACRFYFQQEDVSRVRTPGGQHSRHSIRNGPRPISAKKEEADEWTTVKTSLRRLTRSTKGNYLSLGGGRLSALRFCRTDNVWPSRRRHEAAPEFQSVCPCASIH